MRLSSTIRGWLIGVLLFGYAYFLHWPAVSFTASFLIAALLQLAVILSRKFLPTEQWPTAQYVFEMVADGATILLFALTLWGGILKPPEAL